MRWPTTLLAVCLAVLPPAIVGAQQPAPDAKFLSNGRFNLSTEKSSSFCQLLTLEQRQNSLTCAASVFSDPRSASDKLRETLAKSNEVYVLKPAEPAPKPYAAPHTAADAAMSAERRQALSGALAAASWQGYKLGTSIAYNELTQSQIAAALERAPVKVLTKPQNEAAAKVAIDMAKSVLSKSGPRQVMLLVAIGAGSYAAYQFVKGEDETGAAAASDGAAAPSAPNRPAGVPEPSPSLAPSAGEAASPKTMIASPSFAIPGQGNWFMREIGGAELPALDQLTAPATGHSK